mmetsp:Transcript_28081/g.39622  ORF Transcript_28081/g.39622 Transcript_28081/m.39622 type:complete len:228 (+) Transcript_28081:1014-1697(+)
MYLYCKCENSLSRIFIGTAVLQALEIFHCLDSQFSCGVFIATDHSLWMHLDGRDSPHVIHTLFYSFVKSKGLVASCNNNNNFSSCHHSCNTHSQSHLGHFVNVTSKESSIRFDGVVCKGLNSSFAGQAGARLVESNVTISANTTKEEFNSTNSCNFLFIVFALLFKILGIAIQNVDVLLLDVDVIEKVLSHECMIRFRVVFWQVDVLIHVKGNYILKGDFSFFVEFD